MSYIILCIILYYTVCSIFDSRAGVVLFVGGCPISSSNEAGLMPADLTVDCAELYQSLKTLGLPEKVWVGGWGIYVLELKHCEAAAGLALSLFCQICMHLARLGRMWRYLPIVLGRSKRGDADFCWGGEDCH